MILNGTSDSKNSNMYAVSNHKTIYYLFNFFVNIIYLAQAKTTSTTSSKHKSLEDIKSIYKDRPSIRSTKEQSKGTGFSMPIANEENIYKILVSLNPKKIVRKWLNYPSSSCQFSGNLIEAPNQCNKRDYN